MRLRSLARALIGLASITFVAAMAHAGEPLDATGTVLACRGTLSFGDALDRAVTMKVDPARGTVATPDCRKYAHLARYCRGTLIRIEDHHFVFGGAESPENTQLWADLHRRSEILTASVDGTDVETMRVSFLGRCVPTGVRHVHRVARR